MFYLVQFVVPAESPIVVIQGGEVQHDRSISFGMIMMPDEVDDRDGLVSDPEIDLDDILSSDESDDDEFDDYEDDDYEDDDYEDDDFDEDYYDYEDDDFEDDDFVS